MHSSSSSSRSGHFTSTAPTIRPLSSLLFRSLWALVATVVLPIATLSWIYHSYWLSRHGCILVVANENHAVVERYCRPTGGGMSAPYDRFEITTSWRTVPSFLSLSGLFVLDTAGTAFHSHNAIHQKQPLVEWAEDEFATWRLRDDASRKPPVAIVDYASSFSFSLLGSSSSNNNNNNNSDQQETGLGFRRNDQKKNQKTKSTTPTPIATGVLLALNIGMFLWLWNSRVDPSQVALNGQIFQDFGRSLTGNLSHFELWHIVCNMMTLTSLGPSLEQKFGSIPLILWTISFLPITTLVVVGLHHVHRRFRFSFFEYSSSGSSPAAAETPFPSMVGFSGILFAWIVVSTLDGQQSCPIFFLPELCFNTFELWGGLRVSLGPLVQLVVLQAILPRVSFSGHLAGIMVGFLWHWKLFPPLEWSQPCVSFPVLWILCKYYCYRHRTPPSSSGESTPWLVAVHGEANDDVAPAIQRLVILRNCLVVHLMLLAWFLGIHFAWTVAQLLLIVILFKLLHAGMQLHTDESRREVFGVVGRAYVFLVLVLLATDGLTIGAWFATWGLWPSPMTAFLLLLVRDASFLLSVSLVVRTLQLVNQTTTSGGTWAAFVWAVARCFEPTGKWLENRHPFVCLDRLSYYRKRQLTRSDMNQKGTKAAVGVSNTNLLQNDAEEGRRTTELV